MMKTSEGDEAGKTVKMAAAAKVTIDKAIKTTSELSKCCKGPGPVSSGSGE